MRLKKIGVVVKDGNINFALNKFKSEVKKSGKLDEYLDRMYYEKPSEKRNRINNY